MKPVALISAKKRLVNADWQERNLYWGRFVDIECALVRFSVLSAVLLQSSACQFLEKRVDLEKRLLFLADSEFMIFLSGVDMAVIHILTCTLHSCNTFSLYAPMKDFWNFI